MFVVGVILGIILNYIGFMIILVINIIMFFVVVLLVVVIKVDLFVNKGINEELVGFFNGLEYIWKYKLILSMGIILILFLIVM